MREKKRRKEKVQHSLSTTPSCTRALLSGRKCQDASNIIVEGGFWSFKDVLHVARGT